MAKGLNATLACMSNPWPHRIFVNNRIDTLSALMLLPNSKNCKSPIATSRLTISKYRGEHPPLFFFFILPNRLQLELGGYISDAERSRLYLGCCLALCCSTAEGFGHSILEATAFGCMVVTSNAPPMNALLTVPDTFALAEAVSLSPDDFKNERDSSANGYAPHYVVAADSIAKAALSLFSDSGPRATPLQCFANWGAHINRFETAFPCFVDAIIDRVKNSIISQRERKSNTPRLETVVVGEKNRSGQFVYGGYDAKFVFKILANDEHILPELRKGWLWDKSTIIMAW